MRNRGVGFAVFVRRGADETKIHEIYEKEVFLPHVHLKREMLLGHEIDNDCIPPHLCAA